MLYMSFFLAFPIRTIYSIGVSHFIPLRQYHFDYRLFQIFDSYISANNETDEQGKYIQEETERPLERHSNEIRSQNN